MTAPDAIHSKDSVLRTDRFFPIPLIDIEGMRLVRSFVRPFLR